MESPSRKILIIDDNAIDRETYRRYLDRNATRQNQFYERNSVENAIDDVLAFKPDCILLDYQLPDGTGIEFLNSLTKVGGTRAYPVVMLTGTGSETVAVEVMKVGAQDYVTKDRLNAEVLRLAVDGAIYKARTERLLDEQREELERLFHEAQVANARKDQFLAALSHELRTPLTPILTAVSAVDPRTAPPEELAEIFTMIRRNIELEARLIDDMLDLTRIARGKLEINLRTIDVHSILKHAANTVMDEVEAKALRLTWKLDARGCVINADPARLQQVFWNLLKNAVKFTPARGEIIISTRDGDGCRVEVEVADTGIGIEPEKLEKIFDAFEQGNASITRHYGGLGLGLAISKALIEAHNGNIRAEVSKEHGGASFIVTLHTHQATAADAPVLADPVPVFNTQEHPHTILLVEDHEDSAILLSKILRRKGHRVVLAASVVEALKVFESEQVDSVISDIGLPDGNGIDLMRQISAIRKVPAIALSGFGMDHDLQRSEDAGFVEHLTKPVDFQKLEQAVENLRQSSAAPVAET